MVRKIRNLTKIASGVELLKPFLIVPREAGFGSISERFGASGAGFVCIYERFGASGAGDEDDHDDDSSRQAGREYLRFLIS